MSEPLNQLIHKKSYKKSNFSTSFLFLPEEKNHALATIYELARIVDDIADNNGITPESKRNKLNQIKDTINRIYKNIIPEEKFYSELKELIDRYRLPEHAFNELIDGMIFDTYEVNIKTQEELENYMYKVASAVGIMVLHICEYKGNDLNDIAKYTGYALQLTNIIRDVKEDIKRKRCYIPLEHRQKFGIGINLNEKEINSENFKELIRYEIEIAKKYYRKADELIKKNRSKELFVPALIKNLYREILKNFDNTAKNHKITKYTRIKAVFKSFIEIYL